MLNIKKNKKKQSIRKKNTDTTDKSFLSQAIENKINQSKKISYIRKTYARSQLT